MKKMKNLFLALMLLLWISCDDDQNEGKGISGDWNLESNVCCDWPIEIFSKGDVIWNINSELDKLKIMNAKPISELSEYSFKKSGIYSISVESNKITINYQDINYTFDCFQNDTILTLSDSPESDGAMMIFSR